MLGAALGPVLGGVLTQLFDWRAIFVVQAPVAAVALFATVSGPEAPVSDRPGRRGRGALAADAALGFVFAALVGALFLAVLLVITVWGLEPVVGALVVSALPAATIAARPFGRGCRAAASRWAEAFCCSPPGCSRSRSCRGSRTCWSRSRSPSAGSGSGSRCRC